MAENNKLEFVSPFALKNCKSRLEGRHEQATLFAWRGQTRTHVTVRQVDNGTCTFVLKKVEKSGFSGIGSMSRVKGILRKTDNDRTFVIAEAKISIFWMVLGSLLLGGLIGWMIFSLTVDAATPTIQDYALLVFASIGGVAAMALFSWWYAMRDIHLLTSILKESLGYMPENEI